MSVYRFREGSRFRGDAEATALELERIRSEYGGLLPDDIVAEAEPEDSVLHPHFEWDNSRAAREYRLEQGRRLPRSIEVIRDESREPIRMYVHVSRAVGYVPLETIVVKSNDFVQALAEAVAFTESAERRVSELLGRAWMDNSDEAEQLTLALDSLHATLTALRAVRVDHPEAVAA
ncbi:MAG: hypothetical protein IT345_10655 [Trueperaceae bacterium]|nr:hypothetical protein [Trueperaceae bacterium]